ncbi:MAG: ABC transporter permease subunit [Anaerolineales bacterium]|nr:ABC transporter permease subunit [Anaerolineales bacterium]
MRGRTLAILAGLWLLIAFVSSLGGPLLISNDPYQPVGAALSPPGEGGVLGTDALGRDFLSRLLHGGRVSLSASLGAAFITIIFGALIGIIASTLSSWPDRLILWSSNAMLAIPGLLLAMILVAGMGPGLLTVVLAVGLAGIPGFIRVSRTNFMQVQSQNYVQAAKALGGGKAWTAWVHVIPNSLPHLLALGTLYIAWAFLGITTLTFLGLAGDPSLPEWGTLLNSGRAYLIDYPHLAIIPGILISLTIIAIHYLGTWFSRITAPKQRM